MDTLATSAMAEYCKLKADLFNDIVRELVAGYTGEFTISIRCGRTAVGEFHLVAADRNLSELLFSQLSEYFAGKEAAYRHNLITGTTGLQAMAQRGSSQGIKGADV